MNDLFLRACFGQEVERTPVWIMRQAGRYLPEYRAVREKYDFWTVCRTPELATQVTLQPIDRLGVDAAILFSDILVPLPPMGCPVEFRPAPAIATPIRSRAQVEALRQPDPAEDLDYVLAAIAMLQRELAGRVPLIGFGGAPATLAAYMIEGGGGKFHHFRGFLHENPKVAEHLFQHLADAQIAFLSAQIRAGAHAVQIFDSWGGLLSREQYARFELPAMQRLVEGLRREGRSRQRRSGEGRGSGGRGEENDGSGGLAGEDHGREGHGHEDVPIIYYIRDAAHLLDLLAATGADVLSLDEKMPLDLAAERIGPGPALQGNLDNTLLAASHEAIERGVRRVLAEAPAGRGHVFNLGHGILPHIPPENAEFMVAAVHRLSQRVADRAQ